jgi:hypothetical protein
MLSVPIPVAAWSKVSVNGCLLAGIVGLKPTGGMDICLLWGIRWRALWRANHSSRGALANVVCLRVTEEPRVGGLGPLGVTNRENKCYQFCIFMLCTVFWQRMSEVNTDMENLWLVFTELYQSSSGPEKWRIWIMSRASCRLQGTLSRPVSLCSSLPPTFHLMPVLPHRWIKSHFRWKRELCQQLILAFHTNVVALTSALPLC